jgi:hypothetical protein
MVPSKINIDLERMFIRFLLARIFIRQLEDISQNVWNKYLAINFNEFYPGCRHSAGCPGNRTRLRLRCWGLYLTPRRISKYARTRRHRALAVAAVGRTCRFVHHRHHQSCGSLLLKFASWQHSGFFDIVALCNNSSLCSAADTYRSFVVLLHIDYRRRKQIFRRLN